MAKLRVTNFVFVEIWIFGSFRIQLLLVVVYKSIDEHDCLELISTEPATRASLLRTKLDYVKHLSIPLQGVNL